MSWWLVRGKSTTWLEQYIMAFSTVADYSLVFVNQIWALSQSIGFALLLFARFLLICLFIKRTERPSDWSWKDGLMSFATHWLNLSKVHAPSMSFCIDFKREILSWSDFWHHWWCIKWSIQIFDHLIHSSRWPIQSQANSLLTIIWVSSQHLPPWQSGLVCNERSWQSLGIWWSRAPSVLIRPFSNKVIMFWKPLIRLARFVRSFPPTC